MPTLNQLATKVSRIHRPVKKFKPALSKCPQKKGYCLKVVFRSPKKPNSARRKTTRVLVLSNKYRVYCGIIGFEDNLQKWSNVLIRGGRRRDIPGVRYVTIRGKYDLIFDSTKRSRRSKYGLKKNI